MSDGVPTSGYPFTPSYLPISPPFFLSAGDVICPVETEGIGGHSRWEKSEMTITKNRELLSREHSWKVGPTEVSD